MAESDVQKALVSAFDTTFNVDMSIRVDQPVGSMSISPCGRDVVLAS
jgi:WD repeat-containing protein 59